MTRIGELTVTLTPIRAPRRAPATVTTLRPGAVRNPNRPAGPPRRRRQDGVRTGLRLLLLTMTLWFEMSPGGWVALRSVPDDECRLEARYWNTAGFAAACLQVGVTIQ